MPFDLKKHLPKPGQRFALPHTRREFVRRLTPIECERLHGLPDD
ncbi:hypothetical protein [Massilia aerilata]|uniref:DUF4158 domain-containing protein n=1 Tax=Massilia aerilata TaxID=453817 RepID=A0ABW0RR59_9BURK